MPEVGKRVLVAVSALAVLAAPAAALAQTAAERELVSRYAPIVMHKENPNPPCSRSGEQYRLAPVDITLGNTQVRLVRRPSGGGSPAERPRDRSHRIGSRRPRLGLLPRPAREPAAAGLPLRPRVGEAHGGALVGHLRPCREPGVRGIAVQYWFYYWFNQFNDLHESDWEMIQVAFDAATAEEALAAALRARLRPAQRGRAPLLGRPKGREGGDARSFTPRRARTRASTGRRSSSATGSMDRGSAATTPAGHPPASRRPRSSCRRTRRSTPSSHGSRTKDIGAGTRRASRTARPART